ncbi:M56 family metallopeptidase [Xanthomonas melonis]|uniref:M56 family metallopeptidase n=1 Tax=Xanthomonas melonis TaxID=56456 RepID=UPI001E3ACEF6|nr:M56 family metallopeptidase [Xanthomonas melonis]
MLLLVALLLRGKIGAAARSWVLLGAFGLAAVSPLAILLPGTATPVEISRPAQAPSALQPATFALQADRLDHPLRSETPSSSAAMVMTALASVWIAGTLWSLLRLLQGWHLARVMRGNAQRSPQLEQLLGSALPGNTRVALCASAACPMVVGLTRPCILVPAALASAVKPAVMRDLLLHEVAHLQRRDLWVSTVQRAVLALYWWSPCMKRLGTQLDVAREMACDAHAARCVGSGSVYARSLLDAASNLAAQRNTTLPLAVGMSGHRGGLAQRIESLLESDARSAVRHHPVAWAVVCLAALSLQIGMTLAATPRLGMAAQPSSSTKPELAGAAQLIEAAESGQVAVVRRLVAAGVKVDVRVPGDGTALIVAAKRGDLEMVEQLLALGARPDQASVGDGNALIAAASGGHLPVVERLLAAKANVNGMVVHDETPLINASRHGHLPVVTYLVEHGADVNLGVVADAWQWRSPLNQASTSAIRRYLTRNGAVARK